MEIVRIYSKEEIKKIRESGKILRGLFDNIKRELRPGISTKMIDSLVYEKLKEKGAYPAFLGFQSYPASICISINEEIVHGIPDEKRIVKEGDIVKVDIGVKYKGYISDSAYTYGIGKISPDAERLIKVTYNALYKGIKQAVPGNRIGDIGYTIQKYVEEFGYTPVRDFVGHGVGLELHEDPPVPNYGNPNTGKRLKSGMVLAIEPMINEGTEEAIIKENGWTAVTADGKLSAHFEHTVAITDNGPQILTI